MLLAYGDYVDVPPAARVAALMGLVDLALSSIRLTDLLTARVEESTKERSQRLKQLQVSCDCSKYEPRLHRMQHIVAVQGSF